MRQPKPTYEELEARNEQLERAFRDMSSWRQVAYGHANNPANSADVRAMCARLHSGMQRILGKVTT